MGKDGYLKVIDVGLGQVTKAFKISEFALSSVALLSPTHLILGCWDNSLYIFNLTYGSVTQRLAHCHYDSISCIQKRDNSLFTGSWDCTVK